MVIKILIQIILDNRNLQQLRLPIYGPKGDQGPPGMMGLKGDKGEPGIGLF